MVKSDWRTAGEFIALVSVVVSLLFVGYELRMNRQVAINESFASAASVTPDITELIISNASIWERGCADEELSREEEVIFGGLVNAVDRHFFYRYRRTIDGITTGVASNWANRVARNRALFPGFDRKWREIYSTSNRGETAGGGDWGELVRERYDEVSQTLSPNSFDSTLCGIYGL